MFRRSPSPLVERVLLVVVAWVLSLAQGCASLPSATESVPSVAIPIDAQEGLGRIAAQSVPADAGAGFRPLQISGYSMDARLALVGDAQKSLDLQYYLLQDDATGRTLLRAVRDAAVRGVRVRLLVDDLYTADNVGMLQGLQAYPNVEVRLFNPFASGRAFLATRWAASLFDFARVNHRMHNKMFIADGAFAIAGGRNIADEYFFNSEEGNFLDFDLLIAGDAVPRMAEIFDRYWNSRWAYPLQTIEPLRKDPSDARDEFERLTKDAGQVFAPLPPDAVDVLGYGLLSTDLRRPPLKLLFGRVDVFADDPEKVSGHGTSETAAQTVTARVIKAMADTTSTLTINTPYYIPGTIGLEGMRRARERGVHVELVTNTLAANDELLAGAAYARYRVALLRLGVEIHEISSTALGRINPAMQTALGNTVGRSHAKLVVLDGRRTFVGSMNLDHRSSQVNTEFGLLIDSPELASDVLSVVDWLQSAGTYRLRLNPSGERVQWVIVEDGVERVEDDEPELGAAARLKILLLSPLVRESLL